MNRFTYVFSGHSTSFLLRFLATVLVVTLSTLPGAAFAENPTPASVDTSGYDQQMDGLKESYSSMAAAMTAYYAANRGQAFGAFLVDNPNALSRLSGSNKAGDLNKLLSEAATVRNPADLDALLVRNGVGLDVNSWNSLGGAAADLQAKSRSIDATVVNAGMNWAAALGSMVVPTVKSPGIPALDTTLATSMPQEGLAFGLFLNRSLATLIGNFPDVFAQVRATGVASPDANSRWRAAMESAGGATYEQLRNVVGTSTCGTAFVNGLTGSAGEGCPPCTIAGMYGNAQLQLALDPSKVTGVPGSSNPVLNVAEWGNLTPEQRVGVTAKNPALAKNLDEAFAGSSSGCTAAAPVVADATAQSLPKLVSYLSGR
jgi:hypothetical protein